MVLEHQGISSYIAEYRSAFLCVYGLTDDMLFVLLNYDWGVNKHDDIIKWKHFLRYWPFVRGIHRWPVHSPHKGHWHGALMFSLICAWIDGWANSPGAGDLRCHCAHYDVTVMNSCHFADHISNTLSGMTISYPLIKISLRFVSKYPNDSKSALVQVIAWCRQTLISTKFDEDIKCSPMVSSGQSELKSWRICSQYLITWHSAITSQYHRDVRWYDHVNIVYTKMWLTRYVKSMLERLQLKANGCQWSGYWMVPHSINCHEYIYLWCQNTITQWCHTSNMGSEITGNLTVCLTVCSDWHHSQHQSWAFLVLCEGNPFVIGGIHTQRASSAESFSMAWCHHGYSKVSL